MIAGVLACTLLAVGCDGSDDAARVTTHTDALSASTTSAPTSTIVVTTTLPVPTTTTSTPTTTTTITTTTTTSTTTTTLPPVTLPSSTLPTPPSTAIPAPGSSGSIRDVRPPSDIPPPPIPDGWIVEPIGISVQGREIDSWSRRVDGPARTVVVIGAVHGNEPASPPTVRALVEVAYPDDMEVWLVPTLNPDGVAAGTRWNANGVDLNRNFPWDWRAVDGGPGPLSEPEAQAAVSLVDRLRPDVVVWVHQPYGYVTSVGGSNDVYEQSWSAGSGLPARPDVTQHGGGESWAHFQAGLDSMLVEIGTWAATPEIVAAQRAGFEQLIASL